MESISLPEFSRSVQDVITGQIPSLAYMDSLDMVQEVSGGLYLLEQLDFVANPTFGAIGPNDQVTMQMHLPITSAQYPWRIYAGSMQYTEFQKFQNSGSKHQVHQLEDRLLDNLVRSGKIILARDLMGDGTAFGGLAIQGMRLMIENGSAWATYGGIDRSTAENAGWRNQFIGTSGSAAATLLRNLTLADISATRRGNRPGLHITSSNGKAAYVSYCQQILRIPVMRNQKMADLGFDALDFAGAPIINDENCEATSWYGICVQTTRFYVGSGYNMKISPLMQPIDQPAKSRLMLWFGNLGTSDSATNFLIDGITYP
jgi:hypothetical protein